MYFFLFYLSALSLYYLFKLESFGSMIMSLNMYSSGLILLSSLITLFMLISSLNPIVSFNNLTFYNLILFFMYAGLLMCFLFSNFFLFYISFEFTIIPIFLMIIGWGYSVNRLQAGLYMFLYTLITSLPFLMLLFYLVGTLSYNFNFSSEFFMVGEWWAVFFFMVFMVKLPIYFLHLWLPKAHVEAPLVGSMILAGVLLKLGGYGIMSGLLFFSTNLFFMLSFLISLTMMGSIYVALSCLRQIDMKSLVAYSSVVHMGPVLFSLLILNYHALSGSYFMMLSHGLCSSGLFYLLNISYERINSRSLILLRGGILLSPMFSFWWFFLSICNMGCPPFFNFFSEIFTIISSLNMSISFFMVFSFLLFFSGIYCVFLYVFFNHGEALINKNNFFFLSLLEHMVLFSHCFLLLFFISCVDFF